MTRTNAQGDRETARADLAPITDAELLTALEAHIPGPGSHAIRWRRIFKRRKDWRGSRLFERVKVDRPGAAPLELCLKYFAPSPGAAFPATAALREGGAYEFLNGLSRAGTARYFGRVDTPEAGHSMLVLEYVHGRRLKKFAGAETWASVASWLGRLQAELASSGLADRDDLKLPRQDRQFFVRWAERAAQAAVERCPEARERVDRLLKGYGEVADLLAGADPTLVHGELYCTNIMLRGDERRTICPFDWETAAIGCGTLDLAYLCRQDLGIRSDVLLEAYARGWADVSVRPPSPWTLGVQLAAARVHERVYLVWTAAEHRRVPRAKIWKYLDILDSLMSDLTAARAAEGSRLP